MIWLLSCLYVTRSAVMLILNSPLKWDILFISLGIGNKYQPCSNPSILDHNNMQNEHNIFNPITLHKWISTFEESLNYLILITGTKKSRIDSHWATKSIWCQYKWTSANNYKTEKGKNHFQKWYWNSNCKPSKVNTQC